MQQRRPQPHPASAHLLGGVVDGLLDVVQRGAEHHSRHPQLQVHAEQRALQKQHAAHRGGSQAAAQHGKAGLDSGKQGLRAGGVHTV